jgi:hypothetical protein
MTALHSHMLREEPRLFDRPSSDARRGPYKRAGRSFMSGYNPEAIVTNGHLLPGSSFLSKPFTASDLVDRVQETLSAPSLPCTAPAIPLRS